MSARLDFVVVDARSASFESKTASDGLRRPVLQFPHLGGAAEERSRVQFDLSVWLDLGGDQDAMEVGRILVQVGLGVDEPLTIALTQRLDAAALEHDHLQPVASEPVSPRGQNHLDGDGAAFSHWPVEFRQDSLDISHYVSTANWQAVKAGTVGVSVGYWVRPIIVTGHSPHVGDSVEFLYAAHDLRHGGGPQLAIGVKILTKLGTHYTIAGAIVARPRREPLRGPWA